VLLKSLEYLETQIRMRVAWTGTTSERVLVLLKSLEYLETQIQWVAYNAPDEVLLIFGEPFLIHVLSLEFLPELLSPNKKTTK